MPRDEKSSAKIAAEGPLFPVIYTWSFALRCPRGLAVTGMKVFLSMVKMGYVAFHVAPGSLERIKSLH